METGTNEAKTTRSVATIEQFERIITIELSERLYHAARILDFPGRNRVTFVHGDSADHVHRLSKEIQAPVFWYLDAHYCKITGHEAKNEFPLWRELEAIKERPFGDVVWIDDVHTFGRHRSDLAQPWDGVTTASLLDAMSPRVESSEHIGDGFVLTMLYR